MYFYKNNVYVIFLRTESCFLLLDILHSFEVGIVVTI